MMTIKKLLYYEYQSAAVIESGGTRAETLVSDTQV